MTHATTPRRPSLARAVLRQPLGLIAVLTITLYLVIAVIGAWIAPHDPYQTSLQDILLPPGGEHLLGTDPSGRDVLSRLLVATRYSMLGAGIALVVAGVIGISGGLIAGYYRGWFEAVFSYGASLFLALPSMVVLLAARTVIGPSLWWSMVIFGVIVSPAFYRLTFAVVSGVRHELYVDAARTSGLSDARIIGRHILSVVRAPVIIQAAGIAGVAIGIQAGLEFLGLGDRELITWGGMLNDGFQAIYRQPWLLVWPTLAIVIISVALTLFANALRDVLERSSTARRSKATAPATAAADHHDGQAALSVRGLEVSYGDRAKDRTVVVHDVSFDIRAGEVLGLVGESGSGKTQTAFSILDVLPGGGRVSAGSIAFHGKVTTQSQRAAARGRSIAYIPQEPMSNLDPTFTIGFQLIEPIRAVAGASKSEARTRALTLLERVGIPDPERVMGLYPHQISGGMAQRVLIAGAIATEPEVLIADEPTTALDVTVQADVLDLLRDLQRDLGMAMVIVTHNFGVVADICDRVAVMQQGRIVEQGDVETVFDAPQHPYTQALLGAILDDDTVRPSLDEGVQTGGPR
ncbi:dipeptide/oligopeptide/nickel ABC transporter permease/ATP-binding protein [Demequina sp. NBRC 110056]|uniref:dipeptide/oligopeptide/nickel ABC transporter permease/ATP-binding protein n=1 Tax=Demequina sp. NBRC 110056 TaxID=1570345 RepID=UPI0009FFA1F4|nr:dipeptide/oligopeptide/nickel ABC transporter permease/ATP-binding protein [Demequina sp. NBRC 110056]